MGNALLQAASPTVFHHSLDKTYVIAQKQSAISPLSSLPLSRKSYLCLPGSSHMLLCDLGSGCSSPTQLPFLFISVPPLAF